MKKLKEVIVSVCENTVLQLIITIIFFIPLVDTLGQFISSNFIFEKLSIYLLFWPGYDKSLSINIYVWLSFGAMALSYVCGFYYMCRRKTFIKVFYVMQLLQELFYIFFFNLCNYLLNYSISSTII